jgi:hypothetical protein
VAVLSGLFSDLPDLARLSSRFSVRPSRSAGLLASLLASLLAGLLTPLSVERSVGESARSDLASRLPADDCRGSAQSSSSENGLGRSSRDGAKCGFAVVWAWEATAFDADATAGTGTSWQSEYFHLADVQASDQCEIKNYY